MAASSSNSSNQRRVNFWAIVAFAGMLFVLVLMGIRLLQNDSSPVELGRNPNDFSLTTYGGDVIYTADLRGKVVLINFWASWCETCDEEMALLEQAWQVYRNANPEGVIFLGVAYMDTEPASRAYLAEYGVTYPNGPDLRGAISKIYQVNSVPETYILDADGALGYFKIGSFISLDEIISAIDAVLALPSN
jgi:cytochrome c biogenesis protein CcmG, thiol:disulfide interchange protein DsbE